MSLRTDCTVFVPSYLLFSSFYPEFHIKNWNGSDLEFLFQALALPALVPLPTGKKYMEKEDIKVTLGKSLWWKQHPILMGVWHIPFNQFQGTGYSTINS